MRRTRDKRYEIAGDPLLLSDNAFFPFLLSLNFKSHGCNFDKDDFEMRRPDLLWVFDMLARRNKFKDSKLTRA